MKYDCALKKENLHFVTTWINLESIILSKISQTNITWYYIFVES